jgi:hypothetical protein
LILIVLGCILVGIGIFFAVRGIGNAEAGGGAQSVNLKGPSWLMLVIVGAALVVFGAWHQNKSEGPPTTTTTTPVATTTPTTTTIPQTTASFVPSDYGDDPTLDLYYEDCDAGSMMACDQLYQLAPAGTPYEYFGLTCGRRTEPVEGTCDGVAGGQIQQTSTTLG